MTQEAFLGIADQYPAQLNVWTTDTVPYIVQGITIPIIDLNLENITQYLEQVNTVILPVSTTQTLQLKVTAKSIRYSGNSVYYFLNVENQSTSATVPSSLNNKNVIVLPGLDNAVFDKSPYNVLHGSVEVQRQSDYITQFASPTKAYVQDSLYSSTGWKNARYDGSTTDKFTYSTIEPALAGNSFQGNFYGETVTDAQINSQNTVERVTRPYFHTGKTPLPEFSPSNIILYTAGPVSINTTTIQVKLALNINILDTWAPFLLQVGDLITIGEFGESGDSAEIIKINSIKPVDNSFQYVLEVTRAWNGIKATDQWSADYPVNTVLPVRVFELKGNKVQGVSKGKIRIVETGDIIGVDQFGFVITGSLPQF